MEKAVIYVQKALDELKEIKENETFLIKDLFKGYEWKRIGISDRIKIGLLFSKEIEYNKINVSAYKKTATNQQIYIKHSTVNDL